MEIPATKAYFCKEYFHSLDEKGRLTLPNPHRQVLSEVNPHNVPLRLSFMPGSKFLNLYPPGTWLALMAGWEEEARFNSTQEFMENQRLFMSKIDEVPVDKAGRILLPASHRDYIGLVKEAVVVGVGDKIEIWEAGAYKAFEEEAIWRRIAREAQDAAGGTPAGNRLPRW